MKSIIGKFIDGGPIFTVVIFICFILVLALIVAAFIRKDSREKFMSLMKHIGWFAVAWGFMGRTFGLIHAFDLVEASGELTPRLLADGLKMALVDPLFGIFVFVIVRIGLIALTAAQKKEGTNE